MAMAPLSFYVKVSFGPPVILCESFVCRSPSPTGKLQSYRYSLAAPCIRLHRTCLYVLLRRCPTNRSLVL